VGLIKFGSRVDVLIPSEAVLQVKVGQRVKGGASIVAAMPEAEAALAAPSIKRVLRAKAVPDVASAADDSLGARL
jgi:phosphatidylserine decarboxylase